MFPFVLLFQLSACGGAQPPGARCGQIEVPENPAAPAGRKLALNVVVLPATGSPTEHAPDPIFFLAGGPGEASVAQAFGIAAARQGLRLRRDFVLVDQRGTGGSHALTCDFYGSSDTLQSYLGDFIPAEPLRRCLKQYAATTALRFYTTAVAAADLDAVRAALGYERINLSGGSYGTRAALEYLRRYPAHVRSVVLFGVVPPSTTMPEHFARDAERSLQGVFAECEGDAACRAAFPRLRAEARDVLARLKRTPATLTLEHPATGRKQPVSLSYDRFAETLRYMLYSSEAAGLIPALFHQAAQGDFEWVARRSLRARGAFARRGDFQGLYVNITCAEDLPFVRDAEESAEAKDTFLGDYRMRQQRRACDLWPQAPIDRSLHEPVHSDVPVLMLNGALDPVTPPPNQAEAARGLANVLRVIVPHAGHSFAGLVGLGCVDGLLREFVERGSGKGLDTSCIAGIRRQGFPKTLPER